MSPLNRCLPCFLLLITPSLTQGCSDNAESTTESTAPTTTEVTTDAPSTGPETDPTTTDESMTDELTTDGATTDGPTTGEPTTGEPTTDDPITTSDTAADCDPEADVIAVDLNIGGPIFTDNSESLVAVVEEQILELSLCGEVLNTIVSGVDLGHGEAHQLTPGNTRLFFTNSNGIARVSFPSGDNFEQLVEDGAIYELAVTLDETEAFYYVNGGDAFHVTLEPPGQPQLFDVDPTPRTFAISPDGTKLAYMDNSDDIYTREIGSNVSVFQVHVANGPRRVVQWMPDSERIMYLEDLGQFTHYLRTYNINTMETVDHFLVDEFPIGSFALSPDASRVVVDLGPTYKVFKF